ncbi:MAG: caspase family protein [Alphaproteobacteria bacterium]|nr:caspase family protein [Alphaproteobacteria bacterium]
MWWAWVPALAGDRLPSVDQPLRSGATAPEDAAVVVGVEDYFVVPDVPFARRDAEAFYDYLVYTRGLDPDRVALMVDGASAETIEAAVRNAVGAIGPGGTLWFYFSGHGGAANDGARLLLGDDVRSDAYESRGFRVDSVKRLADQAGARVVLVVDACYTGVGRGGDNVLEGMRPFQPTKDVRSTRDQLEWTAASANQMAGPLNAQKHGAFTYFVLGALRGWADGEIDGRTDGRVEAMEARMFVARALRGVDGLQQTPEMSVASGAAWVLGEQALEPAPESLAPAVVEAPEPRDRKPPTLVVGGGLGAMMLLAPGSGASSPSPNLFTQAAALRIRDRYDLGLVAHQALFDGPRTLEEAFASAGPSGDFLLLSGGARASSRWFVGPIASGVAVEIGIASFSVPRTYDESTIDYQFWSVTRDRGFGPEGALGWDLAFPFQKLGTALGVVVEVGWMGMDGFGPFSVVSFDLDTPF